MKTIQSAGFALAGLLLAASSGCSSAPIARGQDPINDPAVTPAGHDGTPSYGSYGYQPAPLDAMADHFRFPDEISQYEVDENGQIVPYPSADHLSHEQMLTGWSHHSHDGPLCPPNPRCPRCQGHPPTGQPCPVCQHATDPGPTQDAGDSDHIWDDYPNHHFTYAYMRPKNLQYPPPEVPGGAVAYPYYTHKGPSDFFRK
jgi:hypothetical protein